MKKISYMRRRLEEQRYSEFTDDMEHCYLCSQLGKTTLADDKHELLPGANRYNSMKWGYVLPLCREHHNTFHKNHRFSLEWAIKCQQHFTEKYSYKEWMEIFHRDYKEILKQKYGG